MTWLSKLKKGLQRTSNKISSGISDIFTKQKLNKETLEQLEELLIMADVGAESAHQITLELSKYKFKETENAQEIKEALVKIITKILEPAAGKIDFTSQKPYVVLVCGVNGNGKTTSIGKLAAQYTNQGKKVILGAADTFRAAAQEQLQIWAERSKAKIVLGSLNSDPASIVYKSMVEAKENEADILMIDTAGRLSNKAHLMDELAKINRVIKKHDDTAPHDTILVLDATTGQNAIKQLDSFSRVLNLTGIIVTKLDGSAKAGVIIPLVQKFSVPIIAVGVGESIDDLNSFKAEDFAKNLVGL